MANAYKAPTTDEQIAGDTILLENSCPRCGSRHWLTGDKAGGSTFTICDECHYDPDDPDDEALQ